MIVTQKTTQGKITNGDNMPKDTFFNLPQDKRQRILNIAVAEFASNPYDVASISDIVRKAGIAKGSFYQYFEDKKDLYHTLIEYATEEKRALLEKLPVPDVNGDLFSYFRYQFLANVIFEVHHPRLAQIIFRAFVEEVPFPEMTEELRRRGTTQFFKQLISQGILHGDVAHWVDPDMAAFMLETVFYQFGKYFINRLGLTNTEDLDLSLFEDDQAQQLMDNLMEIIEAGMKANPESR